MSSAGWRRRNVAKGLCGSCTRPLFKGGACAYHYQKLRVLMKQKYDARKSAHQCIRCGRPTVDGRTCCDIHLKEQSQRAVKYKQRKIADGLCVVSGCVNTLINAAHCAEHILSNRQNVRRIHTERNRLGQCRQCGLPRVNASYCEYHNNIRKQQSRNRRKSS